jgi:hypothetical protein
LGLVVSPFINNLSVNVKNMKNKLIISSVILMLLSGCASVPTADVAKTNAVKKFESPKSGNSGIYVYRKDSMVGGALKKDIYIDGKCVGESAPGVFFYSEVKGGQEHTIGTESEFSPNNLTIFTKEGQLYFVEQFIKMGVFVGGADVQSVGEEAGKEEVLKADLAVQGTCSSM